MNSAAPQIRSVFCQIHRAEPLHHSVVGPLGDLCWCDVVLDTTREQKGFRDRDLQQRGGEERGARLPVRYLIRGSSPETVGYVGVEAEDLNGPLDAEMMENAAHLQRQQVLLGNSKRVFTKSGRLSNDLFRENLQSEYKRIIRKNFCHKSLSL